MSRSSDPGKVEPNPFSYALGRLLQTLRREQGIRGSEQLAQRLEISATTYRLVEAGRALLPIHCVAPLAEVLKVDLDRLAVLVTVAGNLDHASGDRRKQMARARSIAAQQPALASALTSIVLAEDRPAGSKGGTDGVQVRALRDFLAVGRTDQPPAEEGSAAVSGAARSAALSPYFAELLDSLASELEPLQPTLASNSVFDWISDRARSLRRLRAFVTSPRAMDLASGREMFVWDLLRNPYRPRFEVAITGTRAAKAEAVMRQTLTATARRNPFVAVERLAPMLDGFAKSMVLRDADEGFLRAMRPFLKSGLPRVAPAENGREDAAPNIWLIDYAPIAAPSTSRMVVFMGYAGDAAETDPSDAADRARRAIVLDTARADACAAAFDAEWQRVGRTRSSA